MSDQHQMKLDIILTNTVVVLDRLWDIYFDLDDDRYMDEFKAIRLSIFPEAHTENNLALYTLNRGTDDETLARKMILLMLQLAANLDYQKIDFFGMMSPNDKGLFYALQEYYYDRPEMINKLLKQAMEQQAFLKTKIVDNKIKTEDKEIIN